MTMQILFAGLLFMAQAKPNVVPTGLNANERKVLEYLLKDWGEEYSVTGVDIAMQASGMEPSDVTRFRIGDYIKKHPELHEVVRQWGWQTLVLNVNEKLIARAIVNAERDKQSPPSMADLSRLVGVPENEARSAVGMLDRFGILKRNKSAGGVGYVAAEPRYVNWTPWLDFQFHRMTLSSGRIFNTN